MKKLILLAALGCASVAWAGTEWVQGEVVKLDVARSRITLKHEPIRMVAMDAMTMPFKVKDAAVLANVKVGDKVRFEVLEVDRELIIHKIEARR